MRLFCLLLVGLLRAITITPAAGCSGPGHRKGKGDDGRPVTLLRCHRHYCTLYMAGAHAHSPPPPPLSPRLVPLRGKGKGQSRLRASKDPLGPPTSTPLGGLGGAQVEG